MSWFDEQVRQRKAADQNAVEDALKSTADVVFKNINLQGNFKTSFAINYVLRYFKKSPVEIPSDLDNIVSQLEFCMTPNGIMFRPVKLTPQWYKDSMGPVIVKKKNSDIYVALIPSDSGVYSYIDEESVRKVKISDSNADSFEDTGFCFYRPLPQGKIGFRDLLKFAVASCRYTDFLFMFLALAASTLIGLFIPKISNFLFGRVDEMKNLSLLFSTVFLMIGVSVSSILFSTFKALFNAKIERKMDLELNAAIMMRILSFPPSFFRQFSSGDISKRFDYASTLCSNMFSGVFITTITGIFSFAYFSQIGKYAPALSLPAFVVVFLTIALTAITSVIQTKCTRKAMKYYSRNNGITYSIIDGIQKIKSTGSEKRIFAKWTNGFKDYLEATYNVPAVLKIKNTLLLCITLFGQVWFYLFAAKSGLSASAYYSFIVSFGTVSASLTSLSGVVSTISHIKPTLDMLEPIFNSEPEFSETRKAITNLSGGFELSNVSFGYDESNLVINNLSMKINPGQFVAIVGKTGCGKSTLVRLLLGFEKPIKGTIYADRYDISKVDIKSVRRLIGTVMQDDKLICGSIFENIAIASPKVTMDDAWEAAETAGIADDIRKMPMGMHTVIPEGNNGVSGGQRQRILIARAIVNKPKILILDEATSSLDNITQKKISEAIDTLKCTRIVIAHRLSTIMNADRILYMEDGNIKEDGTYSQLIEKNGLFADLVKRQQL